MRSGQVCSPLESDIFTRCSAHAPVKAQVGEDMNLSLSKWASPFLGGSFRKAVLGTTLLAWPGCAVSVASKQQPNCKAGMGQAFTC